MGWREVIVSLNSLGVGDLDTIKRKVAAAGEVVRSGGNLELADRLDEAIDALARGDLGAYRRLLSLVVSRLGHLRDP